MYDYVKLRIEDPEQIGRILALPFLSFKQQVDLTTGEPFYPITAKTGPFTVKVASPTRIWITGSIHKYWNGGTNDNDFPFADANKAILSFCKKFNLSPDLARVCNLEYGVNVYPEESASSIIDQILCMNNQRPMTPYSSRPDRYFTEYPIGEYYIKVYDKGKQYGNKRNTLRFEIKAMKNRCLKHANVSTLSDLLKPETMLALGSEIDRVFKGVVFKDDTIDLKTLSKADYNNFIRMKDPNEWARVKGQKTSTHRNRENRFRQIVEQHGQRKIYSTMKALIAEKVTRLTACKLRVIPSKYNEETNQPKNKNIVRRMVGQNTKVLSINVPSKAMAS